MENTLILLVAFWLFCLMAVVGEFLWGDWK